MISDSELIEKFRKGDKTAFEQLIIRYEKRIYTICFYVLNDQNAAEKAALEVIFDLYARLGNLRQNEIFSTRMNILVSNGCFKVFGWRK